MEKTMAPHSITLAWRIPWTEEPGRLQSMRSLGVGHDWATSLSLSCTGEGDGTPLQYSCLENPRDSGAWWAAVYGVAQSRTRLKWRSIPWAAPILGGWTAPISEKQWLMELLKSRMVVWRQRQRLLLQFSALQAPGSCSELNICFMLTRVSLLKFPHIFLSSLPSGSLIKAI